MLLNFLFTYIFNPLKHSGSFVYHLLWHCQNSAHWPQRFFLVLYVSQNKLIISLNNLSWLVFVMEIKGVFCEAETLFLTFGRQDSCFKVSGNDLYILWPVCLHMKNKVVCNLKMKNRRCWNGSVMFSFFCTFISLLSSHHASNPYTDWETKSELHIISILCAKNGHLDLQLVCVFPLS